MCIICAEFQKENLSAKQVSRFFTELLLSGDQNHLDQYEQVVRSLSEAYKTKLNKEATEEYLEEIQEPFDPW